MTRRAGELGCVSKQVEEVLTSVNLSIEDTCLVLDAVKLTQLAFAAGYLGIDAMSLMSEMIDLEHRRAVSMMGSGTMAEALRAAEAEGFSQRVSEEYGEE